MVGGVSDGSAFSYERLTPRPGRPVALADDERVSLYGSWEDYERLAAMRGDGAVPRVTFLDGEIELMAPGVLHEDDKKKLARLIEAWADGTGQYLDGFGNWTLKAKKHKAAGEPDECYVVTEQPRAKLTRPDFAIEVVRTSGGLPKLAVYERLRVAEVWFWVDGDLRFFVLGPGGYSERPRSEILPALDVAAIRRAMREPNQPAAVRALRRAMSRPRAGRRARSKRGR